MFGNAGALRAVLRVAVALLVATPARADCVSINNPGVDMECTPRHCVFVLAAGELFEPFQLVHEESGSVTPLERVELEENQNVFRAAGLLEEGRHRVGAHHIMVRAEIPGFSQVRALGEFRPTGGCRDTFPPPPRVEREHVYVVSVRLGRRPMPNARANVWILKNGAPVPEGNGDPFTVPTVRPSFSLARNGNEGTASSAFDVTLSGVDPQRHDRIAVQVMEPHGESTDVVVVPLDGRDDVPGFYVTCACAHAPLPGGVPPALVLFLLFARRMLRAA